MSYSRINPNWNRMQKGRNAQRIAEEQATCTACGGRVIHSTNRGWVHIGPCVDMEIDRTSDPVSPNKV